MYEVPFIEIGEKPMSEKPMQENPIQGNPTQINTKENNKLKEINTKKGIVSQQGGIVTDNNRGVSSNPFDSVEDTSLREALADFEEMRKKIRKPLTDRAKVLLLKKLSSLSSDVSEQVKIVEQSTMNCWQGVFPLKEENYGRRITGGRKQGKTDPRFRSIAEAERVFGAEAGVGESEEVPF